MRLSELDEAQLQTRMKVVETLSRAGWQPTVNQEIIEQGEWFEYEASMQYMNDSMILLAQYSAEENILDLSIDEIFGPGLQLKAYFDDKLDETLAVIIGFQDTISPKNFRSHVRSLVRVCPEVYTAHGEDQQPQILTSE